MNSARIIIEKLGGRDAVAALTGAKPNAIRAWYYIGIPYKFWPVIQDHASDSNIDGVTIEALAGTKPGFRQTEAA